MCRSPRFFTIVILAGFIGSLLWHPKHLQAEDDFQYWSRYGVKVIDTKYADLTNYWDIRFFDDAFRTGLWFTSQKLTADVSKHLQLGLNYSYLENKAQDPKSKDTEFKFQHRLELEISPHWTVGEWLKMANRNRIEFRWIEDKGSDHGRYRHRWTLEVPTKRIPVLKSVYADNEVFVDFNTESINENRATPIGVTLQLQKKLTLKIFYLIQSKKGAKDWNSNQVLGTYFSLDI